MTMLSSWLCWIASKRPAAVDDGRSWRVLLGERPRSPPSASLWADATQLELERPKGHPSPCRPVPAIDSVTPIDYWLFRAEGLHPTHLPGPCGNHWVCVARRVAANVRTIPRGLFRRAPDAVNDTLGSEGCHGAVVGALGRHLDAVVLVTVVGPGVRLDAGRRNCAKGS